jgi:hypothetical protein
MKKPFRWQKGHVGSPLASSLCTVSAGCPIQAGWQLYFWFLLTVPDRPGSMALQILAEGQGNENREGESDTDRFAKHPRTKKAREG